MTDAAPKTKDKAATDKANDYSQTLFLPQTEFPMRASLPEREPEILKRWQDQDVYGQLRKAGQGRQRFVLHDGPPYANGHIHMGTALNKILKDMVVRSKQMAGFESNYVPGWDCHGLPIEWKIEEQYRAKGKNKDDVDKVEFRRECRAFAQKWLDVQREEFKRLGITGNWPQPYLTMNYEAEAVIAAEIMKFAGTDQLYRGSKPVMWSVVEKTALAEAEVEYQDVTSDAIWVKFPVSEKDASIIIWTTTPWTIPGNRAISYSSKIAYGLYKVTSAADDNWAKAGEQYVLADKLAADVFKAARVENFDRIGDFKNEDFANLSCAHPLSSQGYMFDVPLLDGDHVTDDAGTGFVHTAPSHGRDDFDIWMSNKALLDARGIDTHIPYTVDAAGVLTKDAPGFEGKRVLTDKGEKGEANEAVIAALKDAGTIIARARLKHSYPHSWRSKTPLIFRNTPQWFIVMDKKLDDDTTLRERALNAIQQTQWTPAQSINRITGMIMDRPDWVVSRQRAWGVPICVFVHKDSGEILKDEAVNAAILAAFELEGADIWYQDGATERFLGRERAAFYEKVDDVLDVWFDSGSTHAFTLDAREDLKTKRAHQGGSDRVMYLEGSDQHRGWFQSSLLESCGTRGFAPFDVVATHGFVVDQNGEKMSKSKGNTLAPQDIIKQSGADILRLWVASSDYSEDLRFGPDILKTNVEMYRKLRNTLRWMLGTLAHHKNDYVVSYGDMPELEKVMLAELGQLHDQIMAAYGTFDFKRIVALLNQFMISDLSAFYFDIRKDALYCDPLSSPKRKAALIVVNILFSHLTRYLAPLLSFTADEAWVSRHPGSGSVHLEEFPDVSNVWRNQDLLAKWAKVRDVRKVVTGALEIERVAKNIGSSLEAAPDIHVTDPHSAAVMRGLDLAEICITSDARLLHDEAPADAFRLAEVPGVAVVFKKAQGKKCARSWKISEDVGSDARYPEVSARDAQALHEWNAAQGKS